MPLNSPLMPLAENRPLKSATLQYSIHEYILAATSSTGPIQQSWHSPRRRGWTWPPTSIIDTQHRTYLPPDSASQSPPRRFTMCTHHEYRLPTAMINRPSLVAFAATEFWNFLLRIHAARIRPILEHGPHSLAWFFRAICSRRVTKEMIFGTWNRVSRTCSKNPIIPFLARQSGSRNWPQVTRRTAESPAT
jgi:hypothetical protein